MMNKHGCRTNQATRNIYFAIDNDEEASAVKFDLIRLMHRPICQQDVRRFVRDTLTNIHRTLLAGSGEAGCGIDAVNWQEIAEAWEAERRRLRGRQA
jgi:hypothetical protein